MTLDTDLDTQDGVEGLSPKKIHKLLKSLKYNDAACTAHNRIKALGAILHAYLPFFDDHNCDYFSHVLEVFAQTYPQYRGELGNIWREFTMDGSVIITDNIACSIESILSGAKYNSAASRVGGYGVRI